MKPWKSKDSDSRTPDPFRPQGEAPWYDRFRSPRVMWQTTMLAALTLAALLIIQVPQPPLPVQQGIAAPHPILARVDFDYVDPGVTATVQSLVSLQRVPGIYSPDARQAAALRDGLLAIIGEVAKAAAPQDVPEALRNEWKVTPEMFAAVKKAVGDTPETLAAVQDAVTKAMGPLAEPAELPIAREEDYERAVRRMTDIKDLRNKLPAGLSPEVAPILDEASPVIVVAQPQGDLKIAIRDVATVSQADRVQMQIERILDGPFTPIFGGEGVASLAAVMASRIGPTLVYDQTLTENRRADVRETVKPVPIRHRANATLVEAGKKITEDDIHLLEAEQKARLVELRWWRSALAWFGAALILGLMVLLQAVYTARFEPVIGRSRPRSLALAGLGLLVIAAAKIVAQFNGPPEWYTFFLVVAALVVTIAYHQAFALAFTWSMVLLAAVATRSDLDWAITAAVGTSVAILALGEINNRSKLVKVGALAGLALFAARVGLTFWRFGYVDSDFWTGLAEPAIRCIFAGLASGILMLALLPFIERAFGIVTNISLLELCDVNQPALRRLALEAPGTYTHSLLIGSLAEASAEAIGARGLLARVGAYFHDIGKALKPQYFVENWQEGQSSPESQPSAQCTVIMGHVKDGLDMADRLSLPPIIRQFIAEHHGTTLLEFFYRQAVRKAAAGGGPPPDELEYRYPGPKPRSRETAIVMLADAVEGATRSQADRSAPKVQATVHEIVMKRLLDGQLDTSGLTLTDLKTIEETLTKTLLSVYHGRIAYPADRRAHPAGGEKGETTGVGDAGRNERGGPSPGAAEPK